MAATFLIFLTNRHAAQTGNSKGNEAARANLSSLQTPHGGYGPPYHTRVGLSDFTSEKTSCAIA